MVLKESFYSYMDEYTSDYTSYITELLEYLLKVDRNSSSTCQPAARLLYYFHFIKKWKKVGVPLICTTLIDAMTDRILESKPILMEVSNYLHFCFVTVSQTPQCCSWFDPIPSIHRMVGIRSEFRSRDVASSVLDSIESDPLMKSRADGRQAAYEVSLRDW